MEGRTQIIVALITVTGVITAAFFANLDKISAAIAPAGNHATATPPAQETAGNLAPASSASTDPASPISIPDVSGWWHDEEGNRFDFKQHGTRYEFVQSAGDTQVGTGQGAVSGRTLNHKFHVDDFGDGTCTASLAADARSITGRCQSPGRSPWQFTVTRGYQ